MFLFCYDVHDRDHDSNSPLHFQLRHCMRPHENMADRLTVCPMHRDLHRPTAGMRAPVHPLPISISSKPLRHPYIQVFPCKILSNNLKRRSTLYWKICPNFKKDNLSLPKRGSAVEDDQGPFTRQSFQRPIDPHVVRHGKLTQTLGW